jgi:hypothetical protein
MFQAAYATGTVVDRYSCSSIQEDGRVIDGDINNTNGFTEKKIENGQLCLLIIDAISKSGDKYSALELSINQIYKIPCAREPVVLNVKSTPNTPVKTTTPTKPVGRTPKTIKIDLDRD